MSYSGIIAKLNNVRPHDNADKLNLATVCGFTVITSKDYTEGQLGCFFPSDGQLSHQMCHENNLYRHREANKDVTKAGFFEDNRRVRAIKIRGIISDGFWIPVEGLSWAGNEELKEGQTVTKINGLPICNKYVTPATEKSANKDPQGKDKKSKKQKLSEMFKEFKTHWDVNQLRYCINSIPKGSIISISEKIHGTSGRTGNLKKFNDLGWFKQTWNKIMPVKFQEHLYEYVSGTRTTILNPDKGDMGFYKGTTFREKIHQSFKKAFLRPGETFYYEIVGYTDTKKPIMATQEVDDSDIKKLYGPKITYSYGCNPEEDEPWRVYVYRITYTEEDGTIIELPWYQMINRVKDIGFKPVVELIEPFVYDGDKNKLWELCDNLSKGSSILDPRHIREGVVIRVETPSGSTYHLKYKSAEFCLLEGIQKNDPKYVDTEEIA